MKRFIVYKITNLINGKFYIGKTGSALKVRFSAHKAAARRKHPNDYSHIHRAMNRYGFDNFQIEEVESFNTDQEARDAETDYIKKFKSKDRSIGYNLTDGGDGVTGYKWSKEAKKKMSNRRKGKYSGKNNTFYGKKHTEEFKQRMSIKRKEMYLENKEKIDEQNIKQCKFTKEQCLEIQAKYLSLEYTMEKLASIFNSNLSAIHSIIVGKYIAIKNYSIISQEDFKNIKKYRTNINAAKLTKFNIEQELKIVKMYSTKKFSLYKLAKKFKCTAPTIKKVLRKHNIVIIKIQRS